MIKTSTNDQKKPLFPNLSKKDWHQIKT